MARRLRALRLLATLLACVNLSPAQQASSQTTLPSGAGRAAPIVLGESAVPLFGPWKFTVGDSPIDVKTGKLLWSEPDFDDSQWENVDLTPEDGAIDPLAGLTGYVPGWTAKAHPGYWGYAWYRIRVEVQSKSGKELALAGPSNMDDAYQLFDNGVLTGHFGNFEGKNPVIYSAKPTMFRVSQSANQVAGTISNSSMRVLAFRVWMQPSTLMLSPDTGGLHTAPVLGEASAVTLGYQVRWLELIRSYASSVVGAALFGSLAVLAFCLILFDRSDRVYLWIGISFLLIASEYALLAVSAWTTFLGVSMFNLTDDLLSPPAFAASIMVWWVWFGLKRPSWLPRFIAVQTLVLIVITVLGDEDFVGILPHSVALHFVPFSLILRFLLLAQLVWIVGEGISTQGLEGWLVLPAAVLRAISAFSNEFRFIHIQLHWFPFGVRFGLGMIASLLTGLVIAVLLLRRLLQTVRRQRQMALDVKQAQEVQQVILPQARTMLPGLLIESEYRPAREVGGDFFQIVPNADDGSLLIVAGDVTGKGLKAGMLVALLVGAFRTVVRFNPDPVAVLKELNLRLVGRSDAQATCLVMHITANGGVTLANAGHMAPYLNGEPIAMEGALPLGMIEGAEPSVMRFQLDDGDKMILMSDGIAEATDTDGKLFGFERIRDLLRTTTTATELANAAQSFGQEDDISVIAVTRTPIVEPALA